MTWKYIICSWCYSHSLFLYFLILSSRSLSILLVLSNNPLFNSKLFLVACLYHWFLLYIFLFFLCKMDLICSTFSRFLKYIIDLELSSFHIEILKVITFPLNTALTLYHQVWHIVFSISLLKMLSNFHGNVF